MYEVRLSRRAEKFFSSVERPLAKKLARCFEQLERDPIRHANVKRLSGDFSGLYRFRVGDYRVVYRVENNERIVVVLVIAHRRDAYS